MILQKRDQHRLSIISHDSLYFLTETGKLVLFSELMRQTIIYKYMKNTSNKTL